MSDDTEALTNARAWLTTWPYRDGAYELISVCADTIDRLERDRDALAERCEKLREALRELVRVIDAGAETGSWCTCHCEFCERALLNARSFLAAPKDAP